MRLGFEEVRANHAMCSSREHSQKRGQSFVLFCYQLAEFCKSIQLTCITRYQYIRLDCLKKNDSKHRHLGCIKSVPGNST